MGWYKENVLDVEPNGSSPISTYTLVENGNWECQPCCNIFHHLEFDLHTLHSIFLLSESQIMKPFNYEQCIRLSLRSKSIPSNTNPPKECYMSASIEIHAIKLCFATFFNQSMDFKGVKGRKSWKRVPTNHMEIKRLIAMQFAKFSDINQHIHKSKE